MRTQALAKIAERMPSVFDDLLKPWNEWFDGGDLWSRVMNVPAVNITEQKDKKFTRKEYNYSSFCRSFSLPEEINRENIEAKYEDGVLNISLPRKEEDRKHSAKHIAIK